VKVRFTPSAEAEFLAALTYIHRESPAAAKKLLEQVPKRLHRLEAFPESGRKIPEFPALPHREVVITPFRFFYRIEGRTVWIVAVRHGARMPGEPARE
jgi:toxin ParE1/3/4